jgi:hypothetical protein
VLNLCELPGAPTAFSLADTGRVCALLTGAGFGGIEFAKADEPMLIGRDVADVLEYERASPSATGLLTGLSAAQAAELTNQSGTGWWRTHRPVAWPCPVRRGWSRRKLYEPAHISLNRTHRFGLRERRHTDLLI